MTSTPTPMTLDELQAKFPHGSKWRHARDAPSVTYTVVGWDEWVERDGDWRPVFSYSAGLTFFYGEEELERIPDPVPCPITEPVTLRRSVLTGYWYDVSIGPVVSVPDGPRITLLPDGIYTWEGGPS